MRSQLGKLPPPAPYDVAVIDAKSLRGLLRVARTRLRQGQFHAFRDAVEIALTRYVTDVGNKRIEIVPSDLMAGLGAIERAAHQLAVLLAKSPEAQDAMVRAMRPLHFATDPPFVGPYAPPEFEPLALQTLTAAKEAQRLDLGSIPYVRAGRDRHSVNRLIEALVVAWDRCFEEAATFTGGETPSGFVALAAACLKRVGAKLQSSEALAKSCARIAKKVRTPVAAS